MRRSYSVSTIAKRFSSRVTVRIPIVRGKNLDIGSSPQPGPARPGMVWQAAEDESAWMSLLFSCSYIWGKNLPYKEVQLPLNWQCGTKLLVPPLTLHEWVAWASKIY